jgi:phytol kinase
LRFGVYFPFKILVTNPIGAPAIIFIPVVVNNIGDGLVEPVGVRFGEHKYSTTALYHKGKFFKSKFTRSYEGSVHHHSYCCCNQLQGFHLKAVLDYLFFPPVPTDLKESKAPYTNDGPFLALVGCTFLSLVLLL